MLVTLLQARAALGLVDNQNNTAMMLGCGHCNVAFVKYFYDRVEQIPVFEPNFLWNIRSTGGFDCPDLLPYWSRAFPIKDMLLDLVKKGKYESRGAALLRHGAQETVVNPAADLTPLW